MEEKNVTGRKTSFSKQPIVLNCGEWTADDSGVYYYDKRGNKVLACSHPIMPIRRLRNIDTGEIKIEIAYRQGKGAWEKRIFSKKTLSSSTAILDLAEIGIQVNSATAKNLVMYLSELESANYDKIEEAETTMKMGWIGKKQFAPYTEDLEFDGDSSFNGIFKSIHKQGEYGKWLDVCRRVRKGGIYPRIVLASSFASVLIKECKLLPFFVHLWGGTESGKTLSIMLAASVWGNPELGTFPQTFNSTNVAQEMLAGFLNSLPLIMDEIQIIKDRKTYDDMIYMLTEGVGKGRGKKNGGLLPTMTWRNCMLTTGEDPIVNHHSGSGAVNRIIEVDCKGLKFFKNPFFVLDTITENYGFAGEKFIKYLLKDDNLKKAQEIQKKYCKELERFDNMSKQAASASVILAADELATEAIFKDGRNLQISDLEPLLVTRFQVSRNERAFEYLCDYLDINQNNFKKNAFGEIWGKIDGEITYLVKSKFDEIIEKGGFNSKVFMSWAIDNGKILVRNASSQTIVTRIGGTSCRCVAIYRKQEEKPKKVKKEDKKETEIEETSGLERTLERKEEESTDGIVDFSFDDDYDY